jgi:hypothetical protein
MNYFEHAAILIMAATWTPARCLFFCFCFRRLPVESTDIRVTIVKQEKKGVFLVLFISYAFLSIFSTSCTLWSPRQCTQANRHPKKYESYTERTKKSISKTKYLVKWVDDILFLMKDCIIFKKCIIKLMHCRCVCFGHAIIYEFNFAHKFLYV